MGTTWMPRSCRDTIGGVIWLPRMIEKARRIVDEDAQVLRFLGISDEEALDIVRAIPDDDAAELPVFSLTRNVDCTSLRQHGKRQT